MTPPTQRLLAGLVGAAIVVAIGYFGWQRVYAGPRDERLAKIAGYEQGIKAAQQDLARLLDVREDLQRIVDRTLGADQETVDHHLRTRLNRISEEIGLQGVIVTTSRSAGRGTPARSQFRSRGAERAARDEIDFVELEGRASGTGTLEQALALAYRIDAEPWLKQIDQVRLEPKDNGASVQVTVRLRTLYLPGEAPAAATEGPVDLSRFGPYATLARANPFRLAPPPAPPPVVVSAPSEPAAPTPAPRFPYGQWLISGVVESPAGCEVFVNHRKSGDSRVLRVGDRIGEVVLAGTDGDRAEFTSDDERFLVLVGASLDDRIPLRK